MARFNEIRFFRNGKEAVVAENGKFTKPYDGSNLYNVRPPFFITNFTNSNSSAVTWNNAHTEATVTHTLNCIPIVTVLNASNEVVQPVITIVSGNSFKMDFVEPNALGNETWTCLINYGGEYGDSGSSYAEQLTTVMDSINDYMALATGVHEAIQEFNADEQEY